MNKIWMVPLAAVVALVSSEAQAAKYLIADIAATGVGTGRVGSRTGSRPDYFYSFGAFYTSISYNLEGIFPPVVQGDDLRLTGDMFTRRVTGLLTSSGFNFSAIEPLQTFVALSITGTACFNNSSPTTIPTGSPALNTGCSPISVSYSDGFFVTSLSFTGMIDSINFRIVESDTLPAVTFAIPEPATWALMLTGFALTGYALRRRRACVAFA